MTVYPSVNDSRLPLVRPQTPAPSPVFGPSRRGSLSSRSGSNLMNISTSRLVIAAVCVTVSFCLLGRLALYDDPSIPLYVCLFFAFLFGAVACLCAPSLSREEHSGQKSLVAVVDVEIDSETTVTVRSWWPSHLSVEAVRSNGMRVALQNAQQWVADNRPTTAPQFKLSEPEASKIISKFLVTDRPMKRTSLVQCAVCLEEISKCCEHTEFSPLPCGHLFHSACLSDWFVRSSRLQCPLCRADHSALVPESEISCQKAPGLRVQVAAVRIESAELVR